MHIIPNLYPNQSEQNKVFLINKPTKESGYNIQVQNQDTTHRIHKIT